jgi:hypothetical protein
MGRIVAVFELMVRSLDLAGQKRQQQSNGKYR